eukprot:11185241-Heterocapsa_arctica.AAC.1
MEESRQETPGLHQAGSSSSSTERPSAGQKRSRSGGDALKTRGPDPALGSCPAEPSVACEGG